MPDIKDHTKQVQKLLEALREVEKVGDDLDMQLRSLETVSRALAAVDTASLSTAVEDGRKQILSLQAALLGNRRSDLAQAARSAGWEHKRLAERDRIGDFDIEYAKTKLTLRLGSEPLTTVQEIDGRKLFSLIEGEHKQLQAALLPREAFFNALKLALIMAKADGKGANGRVKVRDLFPYVAAARQLASSEFRKKPSAKNFTDYSLAMFAFELRRFGDGDQGWQCGEGRLVNTGPNMATQPEALRLPGEAGTQVLWLGVES